MFTCKCTSAFLSNKSLIRHFAWVSLQVLQWPGHKTFGILSRLFVADYIYDSWALVNQICVSRKIISTHTQTEEHRHSSSCLIRDQYFICSPPLLGCWLASLPEGTAQGHAHTCLDAPSLTQQTHTHTHWHCSGPLFALTDAAAVLCWHLSDTLSLSDAHHCLPTTLSKTPSSMCACLWGMCASSLLPVRHYYTLPSFHFYISVYPFNQSQTVCVSLPLCLQARMLNARRVFGVFFLFFWTVVCCCAQTRSGEWRCYCSPVNRHSV